MLQCCCLTLAWVRVVREWSWECGLVKSGEVATAGESQAPLKGSFLTEVTIDYVMWLWHKLLFGSCGVSDMWCKLLSDWYTWHDMALYPLCGWVLYMCSVVLLSVVCGLLWREYVDCDVFRSDGGGSMAVCDVVCCVARCRVWCDATVCTIKIGLRKIPSLVTTGSQSRCMMNETMIEILKILERMWLVRCTGYCFFWKTVVIFYLFCLFFFYRSCRPESVAQEWSQATCIRSRSHCCNAASLHEAKSEEKTHIQCYPMWLPWIGVSVFSIPPVLQFSSLAPWLQKKVNA